MGKAAIQTGGYIVWLYSWLLGFIALSGIYKILILMKDDHISGVINRLRSPTGLFVWFFISLGVLFIERPYAMWQSVLNFNMGHVAINVVFVQIFLGGSCFILTLRIWRVLVRFKYLQIISSLSIVKILLFNPRPFLSLPPSSIGTTAGGGNGNDSKNQKQNLVKSGAATNQGGWDMGALASSDLDGSSSKEDDDNEEKNRDNDEDGSVELGSNAPKSENVTADHILASDTKNKDGNENRDEANQMNIDLILSSNIWIRYREQISSDRFTLYIFAAWWVIAIVTCVVFSITHESRLFRYVAAVDKFISVIISFILLKMIPTVYDVFYLVYELEWVLIWYAIFVITELILIIAVKDLQIELILSSILICTCIFISLMFSTIVPIKKVNHLQKMDAHTHRNENLQNMISQAREKNAGMDGKELPDTPDLGIASKTTTTQIGGTKMNHKQIQMMNDTEKFEYATRIQDIEMGYAGYLITKTSQKKKGRMGIRLILENAKQMQLFLVHLTAEMKETHLFFLIEIWFYQKQMEAHLNQLFRRKSRRGSYEIRSHDLAASRQLNPNSNGGGNSGQRVKFRPRRQREGRGMGGGSSVGRGPLSSLTTRKGFNTKSWHKRVKLPVNDLNLTSFIDFLKSDVSWFKKGLLLYEKYIMDGAPFFVKLTGELKREMDLFWLNEDNQILYESNDSTENLKDLLDSYVEPVFFIMNEVEDAFERFVKLLSADAYRAKRATSIL